MSVSQGDDGRVLVTCFAGCTVEEIADAAGIEVRDLFAPQEEDRHLIEPIWKKDIAATYPYADERGRLLYEVVRYKGKIFRPRRPEENGDWTYSLAGVGPEQWSAWQRCCWSVRNPQKNSLFERSLDLFFDLQNLIRRHVP